MERKATSEIMLTLVLFGMLISTFHIQPVKAEPRTWTVDDDRPADFYTIQEAINAASPGDTIYVYPGTYYEHLLFNKTISLIGTNPETTIIDGNGAGSVISFNYLPWQTISVVIDGFTIQNGSTGIEVEWGFIELNLNVTNSYLRWNEYGLLVSDFARPTIYLANVSAYENKFSGFLICGGNIEFVNSIAFSNGGDGFFLGSYHARIDAFIFNSNSSRNGKNGFSVEGYEAYATIENSTAFENGYAGFSVGSLPGSVVIGSNATKNEYGFLLNNWWYHNSLTLTRNSLANNKYNIGIKAYHLQAFDSINIDASNTVNGKPIYFLKNQRDAIIDSSTFPDIGYLGLVNSTNVTVKDLVLEGNYEGILLAYTEGSTIQNMTLLNNRLGMALYGSDNNTIYHNALINNANQLYLYDSFNNTWDDGYPSGGNYWSDYTGVDEFSGPNQDEPGADGIIDTPYVIDENNRDNYPLMEPWTPTIMASLDINPDTLNLGSKCKWITAYIQLPEGYNPADIDASIILLNRTITPILDPKYGLVTNSSEYLTDYNNDGVLERMVKFDRATISSWIYHTQGIRYGKVALTITGKLLDGTKFEGTDIIFVNYAGDANNDGKINSLDIGIINAN